MQREWKQNYWTLIEKYEKEHYPVSLPDPIHATRELMERKAVKDKGWIPSIGSKTTVSLVLNRKRALTIDMIRKLSELLALPVELQWMFFKSNLNFKLDTVYLHYTNSNAKKDQA